MPTPRIHLTIDTPLLASSSRDTLVLARKINNVFNTALAVASLNPPSPSSTSHSSPQIQTSQLYPQNIFAWDNTFRVAVSSVPAPGTGGALAASLTNAVDIAHGETVQFSKNVLLPPTAATSGEVVDGVGAGLRDLSLVASSSSSGGKGGVITHVFSVADVPPTCRVEVMQVVGGGGKGREGSACRVWQGEEGGLGRLIEVRVSDTFILYWTERQVSLGGRVVVSEHEGYTVSIGEHDEVVFVRYGFRTPNQPRGDETPGWHEETANAMMADESTQNLLRITI